MMEGKILQLGTPEEIYLDPWDLRVAAFVGSPRINALPADVDTDGQVRVDGVPMDVTSRVRGRVTLAVRAEDLALVRADGLPATIEHVEFLGEAVLLHARHAMSGALLIARLERDHRHRLPRGGAVHFRPKPDRVFLFDEAGRRVTRVQPTGAVGRETALV
jgi:multiple sugar transport system ATP-binding protein